MLTFILRHLNSDDSLKTSAVLINDNKPGSVHVGAANFEYV